MASDENNQKHLTRRFALEFFPGAVLFLVAMFLVPSPAGPTSPTTLSVTVALLPLLPVAWMAIATMRHIGRSDEYQTKLTMIVSAVGFLVAMMAAIAIALLRGAGVDVTHAEWMIFGCGMVTWGVGMVWVGTR